MQNPPRLGGVVRSKAGRDRDLFFAILSIEEGHVTVADGKLRPMSRPKRKKLRHVHVTPHVLPELQLLLAEGKAVEDHHVRKALAAWQASKDKDPTP